MNSRKKGHDFERDIASQLNTKFARFINDKSEDGFKRVPQSGGFDKRRFPGDIITMNERLSKLIPFSFECKCYQDWDLEALIDGRKSDIQKWWAQSHFDAAIGSKIPLLIFKKFRQVPLVMTYLKPILKYSHNVYMAIPSRLFENTVREHIEKHNRKDGQEIMSKYLSDSSANCGMLGITTFDIFLNNFYHNIEQHFEDK